MDNNIFFKSKIVFFLSFQRYQISFIFFLMGIKVFWNVFSQGALSSDKRTTLKENTD